MLATNTTIVELDLSDNSPIKEVTWQNSTHTHCFLSSLLELIRLVRKRGSNKLWLEGTARVTTDTQLLCHHGLFLNLTAASPNTVHRLVLTGRSHCLSRGFENKQDPSSNRPYGNGLAWQGDLIRRTLLCDCPSVHRTLM